MAIGIVGEVLAEKICKGCFELEHAKWIAKQMFLVPPYRVFQLEKTGVMLKK